MSARSHRLRGSLGDSWGDAEYESDGGASVHSASELGSDEGSESDFGEQQDLATPLPNRVTRATSRTPQDTLVKTPVKRVIPRHLQTPTSSPRSHQTTPGSESLEPSFIMPTMYQSTDSLCNGSPLRNSVHHSSPQNPRYRGLSASRISEYSPRTTSRRTSAKTAPPSNADADQGPWYYINLVKAHILWPLLKYIFSILAIIAEFAKPLFAIGAVAFLLLFTLRGTGDYIKTAVQTSVCVIPGSSWVAPSFCAYSTQDEPVPYPDFEGVFKVQHTFQDILDASKDSQRLPADMKKSEGTMRDLRSLVKFSNLPSRSELEVEFTTFIETAGEAVRALTKYNSKIHHTMDRLVSTSSWTQRVMQGISDTASNQGYVPKLISSLDPFSAFTARAPTLNQQIFDQFLLHVGKTKEDIEALIGTSENLLALLINLEERLDLIADIANRDDQSISKDREILLSQLWSKLGGNAGAKKHMNKSLALLNDLLKYRRDAANHVAATLVRLHEIEAGLENLRDDVAAPEVLGWRGEDSLPFFLERINKGVERMKEVQGEARTLEREAFRKGVGEGGDERGLPSRPGEMPTVYPNAQR